MFIHTRLTILLGKREQLLILIFTETEKENVDIATSLYAEYEILLLLLLLFKSEELSSVCLMYVVLGWGGDAFLVLKD